MTKNMSRLIASVFCTAVLFAGSARAGEILIKTDEGKNWEKEGNRLVPLTDKGNLVKKMKEKGFDVSVENDGVIVLRAYLIKRTVKSPSGPDRDRFCAEALYHRADEMMTEWNKQFGGARSYGGIHYTGMEGADSDTDSGVDGKSETVFKAVAVGHILVD